MPVAVPIDSSDENERIRILFGISQTRADALASARGADEMLNSIKPGRLMRDDALGKFCTIIEKNSRLKIVIIDSYLSRQLPPDARTSPDETLVMGIRELNLTHLEEGRLLLMPMHLPGHYVFFIVDHASATLTVFDPHPAGAAARASVVKERVARTQLFLKTERAKNKRPAKPYSEVWPSGSTHSTQLDCNSCGPFVAAFIFMLSQYGRLPTSADFTGRASDMLRHAIYDIVSTGRVSAVLAPSALDAPLGAGKPGRLVRTAAQQALYDSEHNRRMAEERAAAGIVPGADGRWADRFDTRGAAAGAGSAAVAPPAARK